MPSSSPFAQQTSQLSTARNSNPAAHANGLASSSSALPLGFSADLGDASAMNLWYQPSTDAVTRAGDVLGMPHLDGYTAKVCLKPCMLTLASFPHAATASIWSSGKHRCCDTGGRCAGHALTATLHRSVENINCLQLPFLPLGAASGTQLGLDTVTRVGAVLGKPQFDGLMSRSSQCILIQSARLLNQQAVLDSSAELTCQMGRNCCGHDALCKLHCTDK